MERPFRTILVGIDFSDCSRVAFLQACRIARREGAALRVVHVIDPEVLDELAHAVERPIGEVRKESVEQARARLGRWLEEARRLPKDVDLAVTLGPPRRVLLEASARADLLVLGNTGQTGEGLGSVAVGCVRRSRAPVLLVQARAPAPFRRVVACTDLSPAGAPVTALAGHFAGKDRAEMHLLHVYRAPWEILHYRAPSIGSDPEFRREYRLLLAERLKAGVPSAAADRVRRALVEDQSHGRGILDYVRRVRADLVVLGKLKHPISYAFLGSTAERVLRDVDCSVLVVPPPVKAG